MSAVVANQVVTEDACPCDYHRDRASMHASHLADLDARYGADPGLVALPQLSSEVAGVPTLEGVASRLFSNADSDVTGPRISLD